MGIYGIKPRFQQALGGVCDALVRRRVHPDILTLSALVLSLLGGTALYLSGDHRWLLLTVPVVAILRTALNALDGLVARGTGLARPWGEVLNEVSDRLSGVALFGGVALAAGSDARLGAAALGLMLLSCYVGTVAKAAGGPREYGGPMGKADRMLALSAASVVAFALPFVPVFRYSLIVILVGLAATLVRRLVAAHAHLQSHR